MEKREGGGRGREKKGGGGERGRLDHSCSEPSMRKLPQNTPIWFGYFGNHSG